MKNDDLNLIERYFDNELSKSELAEFATRKKTDPEFAEALAFREDLKGAFAFGGELNELKEAMEAAEMKLKRKETFVYDEELDTLKKETTETTETEAWLKPANKVRRINWYGKIAIAANVLFLVSIAYAGPKFQSYKVRLAKFEKEAVILNEWLYSKVSGSVKIFSSKSVPFSNSSRRSNVFVDELLASGREKYGYKDYQGAKDDFDKLLELKPNDDEIVFYKNMCEKFLSPKNYAKVITAFEQLLEKEFEKEDDLTWQLALLYMETKQFGKAIEKLKIIVAENNPPHKKSKEAEVLLDRL